MVLVKMPRKLLVLLFPCLEKGAALRRPSHHLKVRVPATIRFLVRRRSLTHGRVIIVAPIRREFVRSLFRFSDDHKSGRDLCRIASPQVLTRGSTSWKM